AAGPGQRGGGRRAGPAGPAAARAGRPGAGGTGPDGTPGGEHAAARADRAGEAACRGSRWRCVRGGAARAVRARPGCPAGGGDPDGRAARTVRERGERGGHVIPGNRMLRLGTRASALARVQSGLVAAGLEPALGGPVELVTISTEGDRSAAPIATFGNVGVFVSALREALLAGEIDLAVHSYKDLPTAPAAGLALAAVPAREDPRDVLVA